MFRSVSVPKINSRMVGKPERIGCQRDVEDLKKKIEEAGMPDEVKKEALKELGLV